MRLPRLKLPKLNLPRPVRWDWYAAIVLLVGHVLLAANLLLAAKKPPGQAFSPGLTTLFVFLQLGVACAGLLVLGKTAKEGTFWGNLFAVLAMFVGMSGVLLAAALWAAA
jgi:hypothetical protein